MHIKYYNCRCRCCCCCASRWLSCLPANKIFSKNGSWNYSLGKLQPNDSKMLIEQNYEKSMENAFYGEREKKSLSHAFRCEYFLIMQLFIKFEMIANGRFFHFDFKMFSYKWTLIDLCHANESNLFANKEMHLDNLVWMTWIKQMASNNTCSVRFLLLLLRRTWAKLIANPMLNLAYPSDLLNVYTVIIFDSMLKRDILSTNCQ